MKLYALARLQQEIPVSNTPALLSACEVTGADAVHPGYWLLI